MLFFDEKNQHLYACRQYWHDSEPVIRVLIQGHVQGEEYPTEYTASRMPIIATRAEFIDIDTEIQVQGVLYRLDIAGMRIKHKVQATKTTQTKSGKADPGMLSWKTYKKFEMLGDLAYAWYALGLRENKNLWIKMEPYVAPHRPDGAIIRPDADEPEVLPPIQADLAGHLQTINTLQGEIEEYLAGFAERVVRCGFELIALKKKLGHGKWLKFFEQNIARPRFQERHAQRYIQIATAVRTKLGGTDAAAALLLAGEDGNEPPAEEQFEVIRETLSDMTDARTWQQLWMDFGLMRPTKTQGGDHGGGIARAEKLKTAEQQRPEIARMVINDILASLRKFVIEQKEQNYLIPAERVAIRAALMDVVNALPKEE